MAEAYAQGAAFWPLAVARELDDLILDLRTNETEIGTWVLQDRRRRRAGARLRRAAARERRQRLARQRDRAVLEADAQAPRRDQPLADRADRAGVVLRRVAARARAGGRPLLHAVRRLRGRRPGRRARPRVTVGPGEPGPAADGQRPDPAADPVPRRRGRPGRRREGGAASRWKPRRPRSSAWSPSPPTTSTGRRRCGSRSRSGRRSPRTR